MPTWSPDPIASYTGSWNFSGTLPAAAADDSDNLLIAWVDSTKHLNLSYATTTSNKVLVPNIVAQDVDGSPSVVYSKEYKAFYVLWRSQGSGQLQYGFARKAGNGLAILEPKDWLLGATSLDGPQVTAKDEVIWVAWRGNTNDPRIYLGSLCGSSWTAPFNTGTSSMTAQYSPAVCVVPDPSSSGSQIVLASKGVGNDDQLSQACGPIDKENAATLTPGQFRNVGKISSFTSDNRPSLGASDGQALLVWTKGKEILYSTALVSDAGNLGWSDSAAVPNTLPNPVAVLVAQPTPTSPVYLLVGNKASFLSTVTFLNLYRYSA